jgi:hypothetical protein
MEARFLDGSDANVGLPFPSPHPLGVMEDFSPFHHVKKIGTSTSIQQPLEVNCHF